MLLFYSASLLYAQPGPASNPSSGDAKLILPDNSTVTGPVTDNIRKKGEVVLLVNGKKTKYNAATISEAQIGTARYITLNYTFYEVIYQGKNLTLLRKASKPAGLQYNGADAAVVSSDGDIDDLFVKSSKNGLQLLTKKNYKDILGQTCNPVIDSWTTEAVSKAVEACDNL